jgi:hypothetical protein
VYNGDIKQEEPCLLCRAIKGGSLYDLLDDLFLLKDSRVQVSKHTVIKYGLAMLVAIIGTAVDLKLNQWHVTAIGRFLDDPIPPEFLFWLFSMFAMQAAMAYILEFKPKRYLINIFVLMLFSTGLIALNTQYIASERYSIGCPGFVKVESIKADNASDDGYRHIYTTRWCPFTDYLEGIILALYYYYIMIPILFGAINPIKILIRWSKPWGRD